MFDCIEKDQKRITINGETVLVYIGHARDGSTWQIFQKGPCTWMAKCIAEIGRRRTNLGKVFYDKSLPLVEKRLAAMK